MRGLWDLEEEQTGVRMTSGADDIRQGGRAFQCAVRQLCARDAQRTMSWEFTHQAKGAVGEQKQRRAG